MNKMRAAIISLGSKSSQMTAEEMKKYFSVVDLVDIRNIEMSVGTGAHGILYNGEPLPDYDCVYIKGSFKYAAIQRAISSRLEGHCYMPFISRAFSIVHDKLLTHLELEAAEIPMPKTYISSTTKAAKGLLEKIDYPIIMKIPQGTQGKGVMFADSFAAATSVMDTLESLKQPFIIQEFIETGGSDIRAFVVGDDVVACMKRTSKGEDKRSNLHAGGTSEKITVTPQIRKIAVNTAKALGSDICGVDILERANKSSLVIEANLSPGLQGITEATGINVAALIARHMAEQTAEFLHEEETDNRLDDLLSDAGIKQVAPASNEDVLDSGEMQNIITNIEFRGERILLPKLISKASKFKEDVDYLIEYKKGEVTVKKI